MRSSLVAAILLVPALAAASPDAGDAGTDASDDASSDSGTDAAADASMEAGTMMDASGLCCPSLPCTCPSDDGSSLPDAGGDAGMPTGGCSCQSTPLDVGSVSPLMLLALAAGVRGLKKRPPKRC